MLMECIPRILDGKWAMDVYWWRQEGVLNTLPIISMALSCQTQLFCVADCVKDAETRKVDTIVSGAVNICSSIYAAVGLFGYVAFNDQQLHGDILLYLHPSILTQALKLMFMLSVAVSVPLMLFPCRNAVYNLFFRTEFNKYGVSEMSTVTYIALTFTILVVDLLIAVVIPNVEFILGLTGALIGSLVTIIIPSVLFIAVCPSTTKSNQSLILYAKLSTVVGILMLVCGTWAVLNTERQSTVIDVILPKQVIDYPNDVEKSAILQAGIDRIKDDIMMKQNGTGHLLVDKKVKVDDIEKKKEEISEEARKILAEMKEQRKEQDQMIKEQQKLVKELNEHHNMHIEVEKRTAVKDGMNLSQSDMVSKNLSQTNSNDSKDQVGVESKKVFRRETSLEQSASSRLQSNVNQSPKVVNDNGSIQVRSLNAVSQEKQPSSETNQKTGEVKTEQLNEQKKYSLSDAKTAASVIGQSDMSLKKTENVSVEKVDENKRHETMGNSLMLNVSSEANPPIMEDEAKRRFSQDINVQLRSVAEIKQSVVTNNVPEKPSLEPAVSKNDLKMVGNLSTARELPATKNDPNLQKSSIVEKVASKNTDKEI
ncbi:unnamed protein product [Anisakis simplex]|uniref:Aa_trans domain-containing protein n=1 Tax=Anisakis simplex TaxID=6269 RepID=A0A0M3K259_ANISI|nr:unnamed protein product [Anisakis simplex]